MIVSAFDFYTRNFRTRPEKTFEIAGVKAPRIGTCVSCERDNVVVKLISNKSDGEICADCFGMRGSFRGSARLSSKTASIALVFEGRSILWSSMTEEDIRPIDCEIECRRPDFMNMLEELFSLPDHQPYLFIVYQDGNKIADFKVNTSAARVVISSGPLTVRKTPFAALNIRAAKHLISQVRGVIKAADLDLLITVSNSLNSMPTAAAAETRKVLKKIDEITPLLPDDFHLPLPGSSEHILAVQYLASLENVAKMASKTENTEVENEDV